MRLPRSHSLTKDVSPIDGRNVLVLHSTSDRPNLVSNEISLTRTEFVVALSPETLRASRKGYQTLQFANTSAAILGRIKSIRHRPYTE